MMLQQSTASNDATDSAPRSPTLPETQTHCPSVVPIEHQLPPARLLRSHSDFPTPTRAARSTASTMKSCLKTACANRRCLSAAARRSVSFREKEIDEVHPADDWDRSPVDVTPPLTYDDILELKEMQIQAARANAKAITAHNARGNSFNAPPSRNCSIVPIGLLPLLPVAPTPTPAWRPSSLTSYPFDTCVEDDAPPMRRPLSPPNTPPRSVLGSPLPPRRQTQEQCRRAFVFVPLLDNDSSSSSTASSAASTPATSACPSPKLQATPEPKSPVPPSNAHDSALPSPPVETDTPAFSGAGSATPSNPYFSSHFVRVGSSSSPTPRPSSSSSNGSSTPSPPPMAKRQLRMPFLPVLGPASPPPASNWSPSSSPSPTRMQFSPSPPRMASPPSWSTNTRKDGATSPSHGNGRRRDGSPNRMRARSALVMS